MNDFDALAAARRLGAILPCYTKEQRPDLFQCWSDRIQLADSQDARGKPCEDALADANRYTGRC